MCSLPLADRRGRMTLCLNCDSVEGANGSFPQLPRGGGGREMRGRVETRPETARGGGGKGGNACTTSTRAH